MGGFIYLWRDSKRKKFYLGSHWGKADDGYICGSWRMMRAYRKRPETFRRRIVKFIFTSRADLHAEEQRWLDLIADAELGVRYYNVKKFAVGADPVAASQWMKGNKHGLGKLCSPEKRAKLAISNRGKKRSNETRIRMSIAKQGKPRSFESRIKQGNTLRGKKRHPSIGRKVSIKLMGHTVSAKTRAKISATKKERNAANPYPKLPKPWELMGVSQTHWRRLRTTLLPVYSLSLPA